MESIGQHSEVKDRSSSLTSSLLLQQELQLLQSILPAIATAQDFPTALNVALQQICHITGWNLGEAWIPNADGTLLECSSIWYSLSEVDVAATEPQLETSSEPQLLKLDCAIPPPYFDFRQSSQQIKFPPNVGLIGRVWASRQPEWIPDMAQTSATAFLRLSVAIGAGLNSGMAIPVLVGAEAIAVLAFFMTKSQPRDAHFVKTVSAVAAQLGVIFRLKQVEAALLQSQQQLATVVDSLQEKEAFLRLVLDNIPLSIFWKDTNLVYGGCNKRFGQMRGLGRVEDIVGLTDWDLIPNPEAAALYQSEDYQVITSGLPELHHNEQNTLSDGREVWFDVNKIPIHDAAGKVVGVLGTLEDVTERHQAEHALRQAEQKYRSIFENAVEGIFQTTIDGRYLIVNPMLAKIYGYDSPEELIFTLTNIRNQLYVDPGRREEFIAYVQQHDAIWGFESQVYRKDRTVIWISENARAIRDEQGQLLGYEGTVEDITHRKQAEETIRYQAFHDLLTGLPNRMLFNDRLPLAMSQSRRNQSMLAVMFLDLDRFKAINDTLGHAIGDQLLQVTAERLTNCLREGDTIARWGGDEFTVLLPHISQAQDATKTAQRIIDALKPAFYLNDHELYISGSVGIALYPDHGDDPQTLLKNADAALYRVKEQGRNGYQIYTPAINSAASERLALESSLHHALERQEFSIYYQPQVNTTTWEITRIEALLRWYHPEFGWIAPNNFIPLAEENGLIVLIGEWVLQTACTDAKAWQQAGLPPSRMAVNLSARQCQEPQLVEKIARILSASQLESGDLELEITETIAMQNTDQTQSVLKELHRLGVHICLDEFGTGYSSLSYLKHFPLNTIKIDRSFIQELGTDNKDAAIVSTVIALAQGLNLSVIAEGVETEVQFAALRSLNCKEMQGYLFSQPMPAPEMTQFLQHHQLSNQFSHLQDWNLCNCS